MPPDENHPWIDHLRARLDQREKQGLRRTLPVDTPASDRLIDCSGNDYLRLAHHPDMANAVSRAAHAHGVGCGSSRLLGGEAAPTRKAEARFAAFKRAESALLLPTGWMANTAAISALAQPGDLLLLDRFAHASLIDGARLAAAVHRDCRLRTFPHNRPDRARDIALRHLRRVPGAAVILITESVFSMDGDLAPVAELADLRDALASRGSPACLILDDAHATGILDPAFNHARCADLVISTASKALGALGGIISGPAAAIDAVANFARSFIYSTGVPPTQAAAISAALDILEKEPHRREKLARIIRTTREALRASGWPVASADEHPTPIIPLIVGEPADAIALSHVMRDRGVITPAIRPPTVPRGSSRVRLSLHCELSNADLERIIIAAGRPTI